MVSRQVHIQLAEDFFDKAKELAESDKYVDLALSAESLMLMFDHFVDAHLTYLGTLTIGRDNRFRRFKLEVLEEDTYISQEEVRSFIWDTIMRVRAKRDLLLYAREDTLMPINVAKEKLKELIEDVDSCRTS
ncbi:MAG: hypothetical protein ACE5KE_05805, partial [Methanosarcinales archaeon]